MPYITRKNMQSTIHIHYTLCSNVKLVWVFVFFYLIFFIDIAITAKVKLNWRSSYGEMLLIRIRLRCSGVDIWTYWIISFCVYHFSIIFFFLFPWTSIGIVTCYHRVIDINWIALSDPIFFIFSYNARLKDI